MITAPPERSTDSGFTLSQNARIVRLTSALDTARRPPVEGEKEDEHDQRTPRQRKSQTDQSSKPPSNGEGTLAERQDRTQNTGAGGVTTFKVFSKQVTNATPLPILSREGHGVRAFEALRLFFVSPRNTFTFMKLFLLL